MVEHKSSFDALNNAVNKAEHVCNLNYIRAQAENWRIMGHITSEQLRDIKKKITQRKKQVSKKPGPACEERM